jgi:hypothetical protein
MRPQSVVEARRRSAPLKCQCAFDASSKRAVEARPRSAPSKRHRSGPSKRLRSTYDASSKRAVEAPTMRPRSRTRPRSAYDASSKRDAPLKRLKQSGDKRRAECPKRLRCILEARRRSVIEAPSKRLRCVLKASSKHAVEARR